MLVLIALIVCFAAFWSLYHSEWFLWCLFFHVPQSCGGPLPYGPCISMSMLDIFTYCTWITWMVDLYGINVGEYGSAMDPIRFLKLQAAFPRQIHQDRVVQLSIRNEREELATLLEVVSCQADIMIWRTKIIRIYTWYVYAMYMQIHRCV